MIPLSLPRRAASPGKDEGVRLRREALEEFLLETRSLPAEELAEITGLRLHAMLRWRNCGVRMVSDETLVRIVRYLHSRRGRAEVGLSGFFDPGGAPWIVWEIRCRPTDNVPLKLRAAGGWLVFQSRTRQRFLFPVPREWTSCSAEAPAELCTSSRAWSQLRMEH